MEPNIKKLSQFPLTCFVSNFLKHKLRQKFIILNWMNIIIVLIQI